MSVTLVKRVLTILTIGGLCLLALFVASEAANIRATSDKELLFLMPGIPIVVGLILLHLLDWPRHFNLSFALLWLFCAGLLLVAIVETLPPRRFLDLLRTLDPGFGGGGSGADYATRLQTLNALAKLTGAVYIFAWGSLLAFLAWGIFRRAPDPDAEPVRLAPDPTAAAPRRSRLPAIALVAITIVALIALAAFWRYTDIPEPPPIEAAPVTSG